MSNQNEDKRRLNQQMRDFILSEMRSTLYVPKLKDKEAAFADGTLATEMYNAFFDAKTRAKMKRLPEGWLPTDANHNQYELTIDINATTSKGKRISRLYYLELGENHPIRPILYEQKRGTSWSPEFVIKKSDKGAKAAFAKKLIALRTEWEEFKDSYHQAERDADQLMRQCRTVAQLLGAWPESEQFVRAIPLPESRSVVIHVDSMNSALGIK